MKLQNGLGIAFAMIGILSGAGCAAVRDQGDNMRGESGRIASKYRATWEKPPVRTPANHSVDGPLMGNGDMGVCLGGPPEALRFFLSKNDFWRLWSAYDQSGPRVFGYLDVALDQMKGAGYRVEQSIADGEAVTTLKRDGLTVQVKSWVAATDNLLVIELAALEGSIKAEVKLSAARGNGSEASEGRNAGIFWARRAFEKDVDIPTEVAAGMRLFGADEPSLTLAPGRPVRIIVALSSRFERGEPLAYVRQHVARLNDTDLQKLRQAHERWWSAYWSKSWVEIGDPVLEKAYYLSLYSMGAASRDPKFPPGLFGTWVTTDAPSWSGDYHLNYNHMAPFYGLFSANRLEQGDPEAAPLLDFRERGRWYAQNVTRTRGVLYPVGIGPLGIETTRDAAPYARSRNVERGGMFWQQRSNTAYCLVNIAQRWRCTYDPQYGKKVYPFVKDVAEFWEDYLKLENDRYVIRGDAIHEGSGQDMNPILTLGLLRNALDLALDMSRELGVDADRRGKWQDILDRLSGFVTQERDGKTVFRYTERGAAWWGDNTLGIQHIYPGNVVGLDSDPKLLEVSRNTIGVMQRWLDFNGTNSIFPAAARVGYDPEVILEKLRAYAQHSYPNGFKLDNPHGIENMSTVPNTINEMLCMSHVPVGNAYLQDSPAGSAAKGRERPCGVIRVFAVWPRGKDARFVDIRCWGAFLVSSELKAGLVQYVRIVSERGRDCVMVNPWPGREARVERNGRKGETVRGERFVLKTKPGEVLVLRPAE